MHSNKFWEMVGYEVMCLWKGEKNKKLNQLYNVCPLNRLVLMSGRKNEENFNLLFLLVTVF